ncbi:hypothetical protein I79_024835 [Cricetulus griseus]|uniref:Uncharacterized protein n=1 Tax=Cricetulus griseus TaxID=10029 RepID=G3ILR4_CRIGR|nr:hypothetical protein I79_024835 [Cricetulus griseus]
MGTSTPKRVGKETRYWKMGTSTLETGGKEARSWKMCTSTLKKLVKRKQGLSYVSVIFMIAMTASPSSRKKFGMNDAQIPKNTLYWYGFSFVALYWYRCSFIDT